MRWPRRRWLLVACLVCLLLLTPTDCEGLQLVGAIRSNLFWPAAPPPPPLLQDDQLLEQLRILQDVKREDIDVLLNFNMVGGATAKRRYQLVTSMKKQTSSGHKKKSKDDSSTMVIAGLSVAGAALVALIGICCCACRDSSSYDDMKDDKPLLSLNLSDLSSGSSRKSSATPIDVNRLGVLPLSLSSELSMKVSMKTEVQRNSNVQAMRMSAHEITTIAGAGRAPEKAAAASPASTATSAPAGPVPPPPPPLPRAPAPAPPPSQPKAPPPPPSTSTSAPPPPGPPPPPAPAPRAAPGPGPPPPPPARPGAGPPPPAMPGPPKARGPPPLRKAAGPAANAPADASKMKLKPFFWDKVTASPDQTMVWDQIKAGSFQFNEEMIESLFGCHATDKKSTDGKNKELSAKDAPQFVRILDAKKAQNLAISLKALSVSAEQVRGAVMEGHDLPAELIQMLLRWSPTSDEELRLRLYTGELTQLGPAEQFLRAIIDVPYLFQRLEALLFMTVLPEEASSAGQAFATIEVACHELRNSRLFKKLLEAVLKTGNRMNDGTFRGGAQAFKLDTLLKLSDVKGVDGKTTLLHFVVQEIVRSEGVRAARAASGTGGTMGSSMGSSEDLLLGSTVAAAGDQEDSDDTERYRQLGLGVVSSLGDDLQNVRKAACLDADTLTISVASLRHRLVKANEFLSTGMKSLDEDSGFHRRLAQFVEQSQADITRLLEEEKKLRTLVRTTVDYFHGSTGKDEGLRLFVVVRDFLAIVDKVCREVKEAAAKAASKKPAAPAPSRSRQSSQSSLSSSFRDPRQQLQDRTRAAARSRRHGSSSSSSDSDD